MQLFVTAYTKKNDILIINDKELLSQVRKVLRAKIGDVLRIQSLVNEAKKTRYELTIERWDETQMEGKIISEQIHESTPETTAMIVAMPNKWDKAELIVQKLSEIGISEIIFWPSERSVLKEWNSKKEERLQKIIKEAVEQSRGRKVPNLVFTTHIHEYIKNTEVIIFDKSGAGSPGEPRAGKEQGAKTCNLQPATCNHRVGVVGPEGGLTPRDYKVFEAYHPKVVGLGDTVLRMETAAIIGSWIVKNNFG